MADDKGAGGPKRGRRRRRRGRGQRLADDARRVVSQQGAEREPTPKGRGPNVPRPRPSEKPGPATRSRKQSSVDLGWDGEPAELLPEQDASRGSRPSVAQSIAWGDDSKAPEPSGDLSPNLPSRAPPSELDPATVYLMAAGPSDVDFDFAAPIANIAGVRFQTAGKVYDFDAGNVRYDLGHGSLSRATARAATA